MLRICFIFSPEQLSDWLREHRACHISSAASAEGVEVRESHRGDEMLTQRRTNVEKAILTIAALLLLTRTGQSAGSSVTNSSLTMFLNSTEEPPKVMHAHRGCGSNYSSYCMNGGECMHPQDNNRPFCNCKESFSGIRCEHDVIKTYMLDNVEPMIGVIFGAFMVLVFLAVLLYCFAYKRCTHSTPLIKPAPSENSV